MVSLENFTSIDGISRFLSNDINLWFTIIAGIILVLCIIGLVRADKDKMDLKGKILALFAVIVIIIIAYVCVEAIQLVAVQLEPYV